MTERADFRVRSKLLLARLAQIVSLDSACYAMSGKESVYKFNHRIECGVKSVECRVQSVELGIFVVVFCVFDYCY